MSTNYVNCARCQTDLEMNQAIVAKREDFNEELLREKIDAPVDNASKAYNRTDSEKGETPDPEDKLYLCYECNKKLQSQEKAGSKFTD